MRAALASYRIACSGLGTCVCLQAASSRINCPTSSAFGQGSVPGSSAEVCQFKTRLVPSPEWTIFELGSAVVHQGVPDTAGHS